MYTSSYTGAQVDAAVAGLASVKTKVDSACQRKGDKVSGYTDWGVGTEIKLFRRDFNVNYTQSNPLKLYFNSFIHLGPIGSDIIFLQLQMPTDNSKLWYFGFDYTAGSNPMNLSASDGLIDNVPIVWSTDSAQEEAGKFYKVDIYFDFSNLRFRAVRRGWNN